MQETNLENIHISKEHVERIPKSILPWNYNTKAAQGQEQQDDERGESLFTTSRVDRSRELGRTKDCMSKKAKKAYFNLDNDCLLACNITIVMLPKFKMSPLNKSEDPRRPRPELLARNSTGGQGPLLWQALLTSLWKAAKDWYNNLVTQPISSFKDLSHAFCDKCT